MQQQSNPDNELNFESISEQTGASYSVEDFTKRPIQSQKGKRSIKIHILMQLYSIFYGCQSEVNSLNDDHLFKFLLRHLLLLVGRIT